MLTVTAGLLLAGAAGVHLWGLNRELGSVAAQRRELAEQVARAHELRRAFQETSERLVAVRDLEREGRSWTRVLGGLAAALPDSARIVSLADSADRLELVAVAAPSAPLVAALDTVPYFRRVTLASTLRDG